MLSAISAVLIPVITNIDITATVFDILVDFGDLIVSVLGITVALLVALEGVFHHRE